MRTSTTDLRNQTLNSHFGLWLRSQGKAVGPMNLELGELGITVRYPFGRGLRKVAVSREDADNSLGSHGLLNVSKTPWGIDTVSVNGRPIVARERLRKLATLQC